MVVLIEGRVMRVTRGVEARRLALLTWSFASDSRSDTREQGCSSWGATVLGCTCGALNCHASRSESVADAKGSSIIMVLSPADATLLGEAV